MLLPETPVYLTLAQLSRTAHHLFIAAWCGLACILSGHSGVGFISNPPPRSRGVSHSGWWSRCHSGLLFLSSLTWALPFPSLQHCLFRTTGQHPMPSVQDAVLLSKSTSQLQSPFPMHSNLSTGSRIQSCVPLEDIVVLVIHVVICCCLKVCQQAPLSLCLLL